MNDDVKAALFRARSTGDDAYFTRALAASATITVLLRDDLDTLLAHIDGEDARRAAAVAAAREDQREACAQNIRQTTIAHNWQQQWMRADLRAEKAEAERDAARAEARARAEDWNNERMVLVMERRRAKELEAERDALRDRPPTREELEYARAMVLLKQRHEDPLGDDLSDHVYRLVAQVEAARALALNTMALGDDDVRPSDILAAMDGAAK